MKLDLFISNRPFTAKTLERICESNILENVWPSEKRKISAIGVFNAIIIFIKKT